MKYNILSQFSLPHFPFLSVRFNQLIKTLLKHRKQNKYRRSLRRGSHRSSSMNTYDSIFRESNVKPPHVPRMFSSDRISTLRLQPLAAPCSLCSFDVTSIPFELYCILIPYSIAMHVWLAIIHELWRSSPIVYF